MALGSFEPGLGPELWPGPWGYCREKLRSKDVVSRSGGRGSRPAAVPCSQPARIPRLGRGALTSAHPAFQRVLAEVDPVHVHMRLAARVDCPNDALWQPGPSGAHHAEPRIPELRQQQQQQQRQPEKRHSGSLSSPGPQHGGHHGGGSPCRPSSSAGCQAAPDSVKQRHGPFCLSNPGHVAHGSPQPWGAASHLRSNLPRRPALSLDASANRSAALINYPPPCRERPHYWLVCSERGVAAPRLRPNHRAREGARAEGGSSVEAAVPCGSGGCSAQAAPESHIGIGKVAWAGKV